MTWSTLRETVDLVREAADQEIAIEVSEAPTLAISCFSTGPWSRAATPVVRGYL